MAKGKKIAKDLTDDWIKQVVTGQRHKLAHMKDGGGVDEPAPETPAPETPRPIDAIPADKGSTVDQLRSYNSKMDQALKDADAYANGGFIPRLADGGELPDWAQGLTDEQLKSVGIERPTPAPVTPAPVATTPMAINAIPGDKGSTVDQLRSHVKNLNDANAYKNGGCVKRMEKGGDVDGPGTGTSDSVPAMLSDGEYVLPADTVAAVGKATLDKLKNATHTPVNKPQTRGMVAHLVDGGDPKAAQSESDRAAIVKSFSLQNPLMAAAMDIGTLPGRGLGGAYNTAARLPNAFGANMPTIPDTSAFFGGNSASMTPYFDKLRQPETQPTPVTSTATTAVDDSPLAPTASAAPASAAAKPIAAPNFMPTMSGPNNAQDMVSEGRNLMNTQGIGGFVQAKGLNRMAQTVNQTNDPLIRGQYELQNTAMTANERLEQAKLAEHQRQQQQETWTPDKNMMGELLGYGRTKGGAPQYVTKESLVPKPAIAEGATGKDKSGRAVVYKNGLWVAKQ
jgi:hypothetical protein